MTEEPKEPNTLVCMPVGLAPPVGGSVKMNCGVCDREVWVSSSGLRAAGVEAKLLCLHCVGDIPSNAEVLAPTEEQIQHVISELLRRELDKPSSIE